MCHPLGGDYTVSLLWCSNVGILPDKSVVLREIRRNANKRNGTYKAELVQRKYTERMVSKPKACKFTDEIKTTVDKLLANNYSPEQISLDAVN